MREEENILEIKSPEKAIEKGHQGFTIINENADNIGGYSSWYDKFNSINWIDGYLI